MEAACEWPQQLKMAEPLPAPVRARSGAAGPASPHPYTHTPRSCMEKRNQASPGSRAAGPRGGGKGLRDGVALGET